jgi:hypothetical protein
MEHRNPTWGGGPDAMMKRVIYDSPVEHHTPYAESLTAGQGGQVDAVLIQVI